MEKQYKISGMAPAISNEVNTFLKACDLGIDGVFVNASNIITFTINSTKNIDLIKDTLQQYYKQELGWYGLTIKEITKN